MAYIDTVKMVVGDTGPDIKLKLKDSNTAPDGVTYDANDSNTWAPIDLTGATVHLRIREVGGSTIISDIVGVFSAPLEGEVVFSFVGNAFTASGLYEGEVEITDILGSVQTMYDLIKFKVREDFD